MPRLDTQITEIMSSPVRTTDSQTPVATVAETLLTADIGSIVIDNPDGIVTKTDLITAIRDDGIDAPVATVMTESVVTVSPDADVQTAVNRMQEHQIKHLVVERDETPVGVVTTSDLAAQLSTVPDSIISMFATSSNPNQLNRYECTRCGRRVTADTQPKECDECGAPTRNLSVARD
ncbi:MAG: putative signal-transduction protein containing cAMP-binding and CBS domain protein [Halonotius sp. J07HN6]|jgi:Predicted signal-transduction protein containing cAMP-binding and CBS domains|nr:MAG: putative signal-transduction protein containing cAMP-binding and CBS domain protein [Halonotius sp. J07HN6]ERH05648.1 MAG: putative signal-transduction protein containing cAMP-binding and CBS domain protein [Halonotius sp. J07HN4]